MTTPHPYLDPPSWREAAACVAGIILFTLLACWGLQGFPGLCS